MQIHINELIEAIKLYSNNKTLLNEKAKTFSTMSTISTNKSAILFGYCYFLSKTFSYTPYKYNIGQLMINNNLIDNNWGNIKLKQPQQILIDKTTTKKSLQPYIKKKYIDAIFAANGVRTKKIKKKYNVSKLSNINEFTIAAFDSQCPNNILTSNDLRELIIPALSKSSNIDKTKLYNVIYSKIVKNKTTIKFFYDNIVKSEADYVYAVKANKENYFYGFSNHISSTLFHKQVYTSLHDRVLLSIHINNSTAKVSTELLLTGLLNTLNGSPINQILIKEIQYRSSKNNDFNNSLKLCKEVLTTIYS